MTVRPGWYPDQNDPNSEVYWDGARWHGRRVRDASAAPNASAVIRSRTYAERWSALSNSARNLVVWGGLGTFILVMAVVVALLTIRPWESDTYKSCKATAEAHGLTGGAYDVFVRSCDNTLSPYTEP